ncbi:MAG: RHS repeat-associated core domain-containing protein [Gaiellaceae bacterium]
MLAGGLATPASAIPMPPAPDHTYIPATETHVRWTWYPAGYFMTTPADAAWVLEWEGGIGWQNSYLDTSPCPESWYPSWCWSADQVRHDKARATIGLESGMPGLHTRANGGAPCQTYYGVDYYCYRRWIPANKPYGPIERALGMCGGGVHAGTASACFGDPVNSAIGAYVHAATDIALPGVAVPFVFERTYNSARSRPSSAASSLAARLGPDWTHSYATALAVKANGNVVLHGDDGQQTAYTPQANGSYLSDPGARSRLIRIADGYTVVRHDQIVYRFDTAGKLLSIRDRNNQGVSLAYGVGGELATVTDSAGRTISFGYTSNLLTQLSLPGGRTVAYGYTNGRLTTVTDVRGGTTTYRYDAAGRLDKVTDQNGHRVVENVYDLAGQVVSQLDPLGEQTTFAWDAQSGSAIATDARGNPWTDVYADGVLSERIDPLGNSTDYGWSNALDLQSITDGRGNQTTMNHDAGGNVLSITAPAPLSYSESFTYDAFNARTSHTDRRGATTSFAYDTSGNLVSTTEPGNVLTQYGRDATTGLVTSVTDPRGKTALLVYDAAGNLTRETTPLGNATTFAYDSSGRKTSLVEPRGNVTGATPADYRTTFVYDAADRLTSVTNPLGHVTLQAFDPAGNLTSRTDAKSRLTSFAYDEANRLLSVTKPDLAVSSYAYDAVGNLASRTDAASRTTTYSYDSANRLVGVTRPLARSWGFTYDAAGNLVKSVDPNGNSTAPDGDGITSYGYDAIDRLSSIGYSDATPAVTFAYDPNGNRTLMTDGAGSESSVYDPLDRLTSVSRGADSFAYAYDAGDNLTQRTYPDGTSVSSSYDDDGRLATLTSAGATSSFGYDAASNPISTTLPSANGHVETRLYDRAGRLTEVKNAKGATVLSQASSTLDATGNPTSVAGTGATTVSYDYDSRDRLISACFAASCAAGSLDLIGWSYDGLGNRLTETRATGTTSYSYDEADQLLSESGPLGTTAYAYDQNGNQTHAGLRSFAYDLENRLRSTTLGPLTTAYAYDGDGKRLAASAATGRTRYLWDPNSALPQLALERDGAGTLLRRYLHGPTGPLSLSTPSASFYYHRDGLGSIANVSSSSGVKQWSYAYEPFGTLRSEQQQAALAPANPLRFSGQLLDADTGLYHLRARQYDPSSGRFLSTDPLERAVGDPYVSAYLYADARPTVLTDPSGLSPSEGCGSGLSLNCAWRFMSEADACAGSSSCELARFGLSMIGPGKFGVLARAGRAKRLVPDTRAGGPHSVFRRDPVSRRVTHYESYRPQRNPLDPRPWESVKRFDGVGRPHYNKIDRRYVPPPHVHDRRVRGGVRPARQWEVPQ